MTSMQSSLPNSLFSFTSGPRDAEILIVGESWGEEEQKLGLPFVGSSGMELDRILAEAGIDRKRCLVANVFNVRPPSNDMSNLLLAVDDAKDPTFLRLDVPNNLRPHIEKLYDLICEVKPRLILAFGNYAFWALSSQVRFAYVTEGPKKRIPAGISTFRGSMLFADSCDKLRPLEIPLLPLIHPAAYMRDWASRAPTLHDLRTRVPLAMQNAWRAPTKARTIYPSFSEAKTFFSRLLLMADSGRKVPLANDIETYNRIITCIGFADSEKTALVLPLIRKTVDGFTSYWPRNEEAELTRLFCRLLTHPNCHVIGQNYIYDMTYLHHFYGITPNLSHDTLLAQHLIWPGTQKDLGHLSSIYCRHHRYWKDDNKEWNAKTTLDDHLSYNAEDCMRTFEIASNQKSVISQVKKDHLWEIEMEKNMLAFEMSRRGVKVNIEERNRLSTELFLASEERIAYLQKIIPQRIVDAALGKQKTLWPTSATQQKFIFYDLLQLPKQKHKKTGNLTLDKEALPKLRRAAPVYRKIFDTLLELRSIGVFASTFVNAKTDPDGRIRTSFNPGGTETFRWSSSINPLGTGCNFQNIPKGSEE